MTKPERNYSNKIRQQIYDRGIIWNLPNPEWYLKVLSLNILCIPFESEQSYNWTAAFGESLKLYYNLFYIPSSNRCILSSLKPRDVLLFLNYEHINVGTLFDTYISPYICVVYKCTEQYIILFWSFTLGTYNLRTDWKGLKVKVKNHTKIANYENKQTSKTPSLISPWSGGRKGKIIETRSLLQFNIRWGEYWSNLN